MPSVTELTGWNARDQDHLRSVWEELIGSEVGDDPEAAAPRFDSRQITLREAGYVFQTWIIEALRISQIPVESPFGVPMDPGTDQSTMAELDGFAVLDGCRFIIESKFQHIGFGLIARLYWLAEQQRFGRHDRFAVRRPRLYRAGDRVSARFLRPIRVLLFSQVDLDGISRTGRHRHRNSAKNGTVRPSSDERIYFWKTLQTVASMNAKSPVRLLVENRAEEIIAAGIFSDLLRRQSLRITMCWESSSMISIAETSLLQNRDTPKVGAGRQLH